MMTQQYGKLTLFVLICAMGLFMAASPAEARTKLVPLVDSFVIFVDHSGSMDFRHQETDVRKINMAKELIEKISARIPERLNYTGQLSTFGGGDRFNPYDKIWSGSFDNMTLVNASSTIAEMFEIYGRQTPLDQAFNLLGNDMNDLHGRTAVILLTDGENDMGPEMMANVEAFLGSSMGKELTLHVVSFARSPETDAADNMSGDEQEERMYAESLGNLSHGAVNANAVRLLNDEAALDTFVRSIFYKEVDDMTAVTLTVNFPDNSDVIPSNQMSVIDEAIDMLLKDTLPATVKRADKFTLDAQAAVIGHTDSNGDTRSNQGLSERRARAVTAYMVERGVPSHALITVGKGEMEPRYTNSTAKGRAMNRRAEIIIE